jgi:hypothetical protein
MLNDLRMCDKHKNSMVMLILKIKQEIDTESIAYSNRFIINQKKLVFVDHYE